MTASAATVSETKHRTFDPVAFLLKVGAVAGAIGSMTGLFFTFAPSLKPHAHVDSTTVTARIPGTKRFAKLTVPHGAVTHLTYGENLRELGVPLKYTTDDVSQKGVVVRYRLAFPGYPGGTRFQVDYDLYQGATFLRRQTQAIRMDADSDSCACRSEFIALPAKHGIYRVRVSAFRPHAPFSEPVVQKATDPFPAAA
jgi:hypothetical protein